MSPKYVEFAALQLGQVPYMTIDAVIELFERPSRDLVLHKNTNTIAAA